MDNLFLSPIGAKAQVTLPKAVRAALGLKEKIDLVGFIVKGSRVAMTRIEPLPSSDPFTEEEWVKIKKLAAKTPRVFFQSSQDSLKHLKKTLKLG